MSIAPDPPEEYRAALIRRMGEIRVESSAVEAQFSVVQRELMLLNKRLAALEKVHAAEVEASEDSPHS